MNTMKEITQAVLNMVHGLHDIETVRLDFCRKAIDFKREIKDDMFTLSYCVVDIDIMQKNDFKEFFACHHQAIESNLLLNLPQIIDSFENFTNDEAFAWAESKLCHARQTNNTVIHDVCRKMVLDWADNLADGDKLPEMYDLHNVVYNESPQYIYHYHAERDLAQYGAVAWIADLHGYELEKYGVFSPPDFDNPADCANRLLYMLGDILLTNICEKSYIFRNMLENQHSINDRSIEVIKHEIHKYINDFDIFD